MKKIVLPCSSLFESVIYGEYVDGEDDSKDDGDDVMRTKGGAGVRTTFWSVQGEGPVSFLKGLG